MQKQKIKFYSHSYMLRFSLSTLYEKKVILWNEKGEELYSPLYHYKRNIPIRSTNISFEKKC